jgi:hypothetical protein
MVKYAFLGSKDGKLGLLFQERIPVKTRREGQENTYAKLEC